MFVGLMITMENKVWERYKDKRVYIKLKSEREYVGVVKHIDILDGECYLGIFDKKKRLVTFPVSQIKLIQEEK